MSIVDPPRVIRVRTTDGWSDLAIEGPEGPPGPQGDQGPRGLEGPPGPGIAPIVGRGSRNAPLTLQGSNMRVPMDTVTFNVGNTPGTGFIPGEGDRQGGFIAPVDGWYQVNGRLGATVGSSEPVLFLLRIQGTSPGSVDGTRGGISDGTNVVGVISDVVQLTAGQFIWLAVWPSGAWPMYQPGFGNNYLSVARVA